MIEFQGDQKCVIDNHEARGLWSVDVCCCGDGPWTVDPALEWLQVEIVQGESQAAAGSLPTGSRGIGVLPLSHSVCLLFDGFIHLYIVHLAEAALGRPLLPFPSNQQYRQQISPVSQ